MCIIIIGLILSGRFWAQVVSGKPANRFLDGIIFSFSQIIIVSIILGHFGLLRSGMLVTVHGLAGIAAAGATRWRRGSKHIQADAGLLSQNLQSGSDRLFLFLACLPIAAGIATLVSSATAAPGGTDVWTYHLAFPAEWTIWHDLRCSVQPAGDPGPPFYPHHAGLFAHVFMSVLQSDILARFHQVPFWLAGLYALYRSNRNLGRSAHAALFAMALTGLVPLVSDWIGNSYADISLAGAMALLLYSVTRLSSSGTPAHAVTFGLATGLVIGLKAFGAFYAFPLVIWGLIRIIRNHHRTGRSIAFWILSAAAVGG
ncbi:MAG TPA: glycosyltransferase family 39 protein, partial [bacterium]|nr:glycosyltransferase family 39 protein [bacterium]